MIVYLNGRPVEANEGVSLGDFLKENIQSYQIVIHNTVINPSYSLILRDGDRIYAFNKGEMPDSLTLKDLMFARQPEHYTEKLQNAVVGIAGLGGLGSLVGENLVRAGVGKLVVADFDIVEPANLNRQRYFIHQIGKPKVEAFMENMGKISPFSRVEGHNLRVARDNIDIFKDCSVIVECLDNPEAKAMLVSAVRDRFPQKVIVAASGVAGFHSEKTLTVRRISDKIYVVGDGRSEVKEGIGLVATRVAIAASIQSHLVVRIILGLEE